MVLPGARSASPWIATVSRITRLAGATAGTGNLVIDTFGENLSEGGPRARANTADIGQSLRYTVVFANVGSLAAGASGELAFDVRIE